MSENSVMCGAYPPTRVSQLIPDTCSDLGQLGRFVSWRDMLAICFMLMLGFMLMLRFMMLFVCVDP